MKLQFSVDSFPEISIDSFLCSFPKRYLLYRGGAMRLNLVVPTLPYLKIDRFHCNKSQKSSGSIAPFSKIEWFHGTTGTTTNAGPVYPLPFSSCQRRFWMTPYPVFSLDFIFENATYRCYVRKVDVLYRAC